MVELERTEKDYYTCSRCKLNSLKDEWCPCPRGGCEAIIAGTLITTVSLDKRLTEEQKQWNKNR